MVFFVIYYHVNMIILYSSKLTFLSKLFKLCILLEQFMYFRQIFNPIVRIPVQKPRILGLSRPLPEGFGSFITNLFPPT